MFGNCVKCGDTIGPWTLYKCGWVCEYCEEKGINKSEEAVDLDYLKGIA